MSQTSLEKFKNISLEDREYLESLEASGEVVEDLMAGPSRDPSPTPPPQPAPKARKRKIELSEEEKEKLFMEFTDRLNTAKEKGEGEAPRSTQVRATPPSLFNGKRGSFAYFSRKLEGYAKLTNVPLGKYVALGVQLMEEKPTKVWDTHMRKLVSDGREEQDITWEEFKLFMAKRYDSTDTVAMARSKLDKVYQGQETVERYIERFMALLSDVEVEYRIAPQDQLHMFIRGLNTPLKLACTVNPATGTPFSDLETLCTYVVKYEASLRSTYLDGQGPQNKKKREIQLLPQVAAVGSVETHSQQGGLSQPAPQLLGVVGKPLSGFGAGRSRKIDSRKTIPVDRQCYFCHQYGHESWQCLAKKQYLAAKAQAAGHTPSTFQPGYYPRPPQTLPVAAPLQGGPPFSPFWNKGGGRGKQGKGKGRGKNKSSD